jgi:hypothetical protein
LQSFLVNHSDDITQLAQRIGLRVADVAKQAWLFFVVPCSPSSFSGMDALLQRLPDCDHLSRVRSASFWKTCSTISTSMLAHFIRAQLTLAALTLVMYSAFLGIMRVPYALVLGTIGGVLEFVPVVGPLAGALIIVTVALLMSYQHWLVLIIFLGIWRLVQDYVSSPRIMGESMELHPLAAIFGVMAGGEVAGILGIYLSIPVMASLRIVFRRWRLYAEKKKFGPLTEIASAWPRSSPHLAAGRQVTPPSKRERNAKRNQRLLNPNVYSIRLCRGRYGYSGNFLPANSAGRA